MLLASDLGSLPEYRNPLRQFDVNNDGRVTALDALVIINDLNANGPHVLTSGGGIIGDDGGSRLAPAGQPLFFVDTNGDGRVTALDALMIINKLSAAAGEQVSLRVEITDLSGNPVDVISPGQNFQVRGFAKDLRLPSDDPQRGVFSAYWDVNYDTTRVALDFANNRVIQYGPDYPASHRNQAVITATAGLIDDIGGVAGVTPLGSQEKLVFIVPMTATAPGVAFFSADAEDSDLLDVLVYGGSNAVPDNEILFIADSVTIGAQPTASVADLSLPEGNVQNNATLTISLSSSAIVPTTIDFATMADTGPNPATAGTDYIATSGTVTFAVGETTKTIDVPIVGDLLIEPNETFKVVLSNAAGATLNDSEAVVTIVNDDSPPEITINNITVVEPPSGSTDATFTVTLSNPVNTAVTVNFATVNGTAIEPSDYASRSGTLTFTPGQTSKTITVPVLADSEAEGSESFTVVLANPQGGGFPGGASMVSGTATIVDVASAKVMLRLEARDAQGQITSVFQPGDEIHLRGYVTDVSAGDPDNQDGVFQIFHDLVYNSAVVNIGGQGITFGPTYPNQHSGDLTMGGLVDELGASADLTPVGGGELLLWEIVFDAQGEGLARFTTDPADVLPLHQTLIYGMDDPVNPSEIQYGNLDVLIGLGPKISIGNAQVTEGNSGTTPMTFEVTLSQPHVAPVTVSYATSDGTATAPADYQVASGEVTFAPGETSKTITVNVVGDTELEAAETFFVTLSNPVNADIAQGGDRGTGTILDDEVRTLTINDRLIAEGGFGMFTVELSSPAAGPITVNFATSDGTATAGLDYLAASGTLTFNAGEQSKTITVQTLADDVADDGETFFVNLSGATGADIVRASGVGTISEVALSGLSGFVYVDSNGDGQRATGERGIAGVSVELFGTAMLPGGLTQQVHLLTQTDANGRYVFESLPTGSYSVHEIQPAFFNDGIDTAGPGGIVTANDWMFVNFAEGGSASNFNFGEAGLRLQFVGKRMFVASSINGNDGTTPINLSSGDAFFAFDAGFSSINVQALSNTAQGATITILDNNLNVLARSTASQAPSLSFIGNPMQPYFLRIGGGSSSVSVSSVVVGGPNASGRPADDIFASIDDWLN